MLKTITALTLAAAMLPAQVAALDLGSAAAGPAAAVEGGSGAADADRDARLADTGTDRLGHDDREAGGHRDGPSRESGAGSDSDRYRTYDDHDGDHDSDRDDGRDDGRDDDGIDS